MPVGWWSKEANTPISGMSIFACGIMLAGLCMISALSAHATSQNPAQGQVAVQSQESSTAKSLRSDHPSSKTKKGKAAAKAQTVAEPPRPPDPPLPDWPVNDKAELAAVGWNGQTLSVTATNSSLVQILHDVSIATGIKIEGLGADQRVFGKYGPSDATDVLAELLEGSGYNVMIIGDKGEGTPRQLVLTTKGKASNSSTGQVNQQSQNGDDEAVEEPEQPEQPPQRPQGMQPPPPPQNQRTPQQMMQELQQRQQQQLQNGAPSAPPM